MDKSTRSIFWILVALVLLSSFSTIWFFVGKENLCKEYIKLQDTLKQNIAKFTEELNLLNNEKLKIQEKLDAVYSQLKSIEKERDELSSSHGEALEQNDLLKKEVSRLSKERLGLKDRIKALEGEESLAGLLKENAVLKVKVEALKEKLVPKEEEIRKILGERLALEESLKNIEVEGGLLEERLKEASGVAEVLTRDLAREKNERKELSAQFEQTKLENNILKSQMADAERSRFELQKNLAKLNEDYTQAVREAQDARLKVSSLQGVIRDKEDEVERMRPAFREGQEVRAEAYKRPEGKPSTRTSESVELPPIVVTPDRTQVAKSTTPSLFGRNSPANSNTKGKIITVNREHNFVVIDLGEKDGVKVGARFSVYRGELELGALEIIQTRERIAAADIKQEYSGLEIMPDDIVVMQ